MMHLFVSFKITFIKAYSREIYFLLFAIKIGIKAGHWGGESPKQMYQ